MIFLLSSRVIMATREITNKSKHVLRIREPALYWNKESYARINLF